MTENERWGSWLAAQLEVRGWRQADLVRESGSRVKRDRVSKWIKGQEGPSHRLAVVVANTLGVDPDSALQAAGYAAQPRHGETRLEAALAEISRATPAGNLEFLLRDVPDADLLRLLYNRAQQRTDGPVSDDDATVVRIHSRDEGVKEVGKRAAKRGQRKVDAEPIVE